MSGAEAGLVLGLVSAIITICEAANDAWQAAHDAKGLPKKLKTAAGELPLILVSLEQAHSNIGAASNAGSVDLETWQKVHQVLKSCDESAAAVKSLFDQYLPAQGDDRAKKYTKILSLKRKSGEAEKHIQKIFRHIQTLAEYQILRDAETLEDIKAAVIALEALDNEERGAQVMHGDGDNIQQSGSGTIRKYNNSGSAPMYNAETMHQNLGKVETNHHYARADYEPHRISFFKTSNYVSFKNDPNPRRSPNTCQWFLKHPTFLQWMERDCDNILWLSANPGCGKSVLSRALVDEVFPGRTSVKAVYFFFKDNNIQQGICVAMCAILHQLFAHNTTLFDRHAQPAIRAHGGKIKDDFEALWTLFTRATLDPEAGNIVCLFDALDECKEGDHQRLVSRLDDFFRTRCAEMEPRTTSLRFLLTSRPYPDIMRTFTSIFAKFPKVRLDGDDEQERINVEIESVIRSEVAMYGVQLRLTDMQMRAAVGTILAYQNRTYLWVKFVLEELHQQSPATATEFGRVIGRLPPSVEDAYERMLARCPDPARAHMVLACVIAARRPLELVELDVMLALHEQPSAPSYADLTHDMVGCDARAVQIRRHCGLFVSVVESKLYFIHQTAFEFLVRADNVPHYGESWKHCMTMSTSHACLTHVCMQFLMLSEFAQAPRTPMPGPHQLGSSDTYIFHKYASEEWASHFTDSHVKFSHFLTRLAMNVYRSWNCIQLIRSPLIGTPTSRFVSRRYDNFLPDRWKKDYDIMITILDLICLNGHLQVLEAMDPTTLPQRTLNRALFQASRFGQHSMTKMLTKYADVNLIPDEGPTVLQLASHRGNHRNVELMLHVGAVADQLGGPSMRGVTALHLALSEGHIEVARVLLSHGANVHVRSSEYGSALHALLSNDHCSTAKGQELTRHLLHSGADINCKDHNGNTALHLASGHCTSDGEVLLEFNPDVNAMNDRGETPLCIAVINGNLGFVKKLLAIEEVNIWSKDFDGYCALWHAAYHREDEMVRTLLDCNRVAISLASEPSDYLAAILCTIVIKHPLLLPAALEMMQSDSVNRDELSRRAFDYGIEQLESSEHYGIGDEPDSLFIRRALIELARLKPAWVLHQRAIDVIRTCNGLLDDELALYADADRSDFENMICATCGESGKCIGGWYCPSCYRLGKLLYLCSDEDEETERCVDFGHDLRSVSLPVVPYDDELMDLVHSHMTTDLETVRLHLSPKAEEFVNRYMEERRSYGNKKRNWGLQ